MPSHLVWRGYVGAGLQATFTTIAILAIFAIIWTQQERASVAREAAEHWTAHTQEVLIEKAAVLSALQATETGQRGFLLTMRPEYLEPYDRGRADALLRINRLAELTVDNPSQQERISRLRSVAEAKLSELATTIEAAKSGHREQALAIVLSGDGKALMDQARAIITDIHAEENRLMTIRNAAASEAARRQNTQTAYLFGIAIALLIATAASATSIVVCNGRKRVLATRLAAAEALIGTAAAEALKARKKSCAAKGRDFAEFRHFHPRRVGRALPVIN